MTFAMTPALVVGLSLCSAAGAVARYAVDRTVAARLERRRARRGASTPATATPWGIAVVNALGALALGALAGADAGDGAGANLSPAIATVLASGFLGSFTTFSTFAVDVVRLWSAGRRRAAVVNTAGTVVVGLSLVAGAYVIVA